MYMVHRISGCKKLIRNDLAAASNDENVKDELNGLDKAVSAVLGQRTIERDQLRVIVAKSKFSKQRDDKGEKIMKPEELVRLYDLLIQAVQRVLLYDRHRDMRLDVDNMSYEELLALTERIGNQY
ncbi:probable E3 ubiquitin-protein ligase RHG1A [Asparagus officinalis]|uniref:probable E3 ubiquitin-protein ligase RHG1A n=1 Tax=Asparagus officinalis TaxID=4686 RepID=UPI00098DF145|nr:probable E3 ubiquitin-protein ligase RHG1A [Asparagus officinalis]